jgi:pSer/pThr/pTyr-binding forkhead associated (FHA) protein
MAKITITSSEGTEIGHDLLDEMVTVGRSDDNSIHIDHPSVSSHHAQLSLVGGDYHLKDLNSTNGTRVNGQQVSDYQLRGGDRIRFGRVEALYLSGRNDEDLKPLPEAPRPEAQIGSGSHRPVDFKSTSPFSRRATTKDPLSKAVVGVSVVAFLLAAGAIASILLLAPPATL